MKTRTILLVFWTLTLLFILLFPTKDSLSHDYLGFHHWDKVAHFGLFAVTGFVSILSTGFFSKFRSRLLFGLIFGLVLAFGTELGQYLIPCHYPEFYDLLADLAGLSLGLLSCTLVCCWKL